MFFEDESYPRVYYDLHLGSTSDTNPFEIFGVSMVLLVKSKLSDQQNESFSFHMSEFPTDSRRDTEVTLGGGSSSDLPCLAVGDLVLLRLSDTSAHISIAEGQALTNVDSTLMVLYL